MNKLVNDALRQFVTAQAGKLEVDLQQDLDLLRKYREFDPDLSRSVELAIKREAAHAGSDPLGGTLLPEGTDPPAGAPRVRTVGTPGAPTTVQRALGTILNRR